MRGHVILAVWKRNVSSFFTGVLGYLFMVVFVAAAAILAFSDEFFSNNLANLDQLNDKFSMLLLFIVPAITMTAWSDERKMGTDELLFTLPATDLEILLAKYLSVLSVYTVALMFSVCQLGVLARYADPEWGLLITTYLGYWLAGASLLSVGMFASALTSSATVAFVLGVVICSIPVFIGDLSSGSQLLRSLSLDEQFREFALGTIPLVGLLYFVSLTAFMLYLNMVVISKRHWSGDQQANMGLQFAVRTVALAAILISVNFMARASGGLFNLQVDLTSENLYSLSDTTKQTIDEVDGDTQVTIHAFLSDKVPPELVEQRNRLIGLLRQYDRRGGARLQVRFIDGVIPYSEAAEEAELYGVMPRRVQTEVGGRLMAEDVFLGLVVSGPYDEVVVPFVEAKMPIEYELTRSIRTVTVQVRKTIGVLRTDAQVTGGFEPGSFRNLPEWQFVGELKKQYNVEPASADSEILHSRFSVDGKQKLGAELKAGKLSTKLRERFDDQDIKLSDDARLVEDGPRWIVENGDSRLFIKVEEDGALNVSSPFDVLVAILPSSLTEPQMANLVKYVQAGYPVLIFDDPLPATIGMQLAPRQQKRRPQGGNMFGGGPPPEQKADGGRATALLDVLEVAWEYDVVVWDSYNPHPNLEDLVDPELVWISPSSGRKSAFSQKSDVTSGLQELLAFFPGHIQHRKGGTNDWDDLLTTTETSGIVRWEDLVQETFMGAGLKRNPLRRPEKVPHSLAAHITSDENEGLNVIYVADVDCISDTVFDIVRNQRFNLKLDNTTFALNAVDLLADDTRYIALRKRRGEHRTLVEIQKQTDKFRQQSQEEVQKAEEDAKQELAEAKASFEKRRKAIEDNKDLTAREKQVQLETALQDQQRKLEVAEAEIERNKQLAIEKAKGEAQREVLGLERAIKRWAIALPPLPALLLGFLVFGFRWNSERGDVDPKRSRMA